MGREMTLEACGTLGLNFKLKQKAFLSSGPPDHDDTWGPVRLPRNPFVAQYVVGSVAGALLHRQMRY